MAALLTLVCLGFGIKAASDFSSFRDAQSGDNFGILMGKTLPNSDTLRLAMDARILNARFTLLSTGLSISMVFGVLGFSLFLYGLETESLDINAENESQGLKVQVRRMTPGLVMVLAALGLFAFCISSLPQEITRDGYAWHPIFYSDNTFGITKQAESQSAPTRKEMPDDNVDDINSL